MNVERDADLLIQAEQAYRAVLEDPRGRRAVVLEVADEARRVGDAEALTVALRAAGWAAREVYDHHAAARYLDEAVAVARRNGLGDRLSEALVTRSAMHLEFGQPGRARRDIATAWQHCSARSRAEVAFAEGLLEDKAGDLAAAEHAYHRVLREVAPDRPDLKFKALNNVGLTALRAGRYDDAERMLAQAVAHAHTFSAAFAALATESQAMVSMESGRPQEALRRYERAEQMLRAINMPLIDLYHDKATLLLSLRLLDEAAEAAHLAVAEVESASGGSLMLAEVLLPAARIALARGDVQQALDAATRAERLFRRQRRPGWRAMAALVQLRAEVEAGDITITTADRLRRVGRRMNELGNLPRHVDALVLEGRVAAALGRTRRACGVYGRAAEVAAHGPVLQRLQGRLAAALRADLLGDERRLSLHCRRGLDELSAYRASFASTELRARAAAHGVELAELGLLRAARSGRAERVWNWLERGRMALLIAKDGERISGGTSALLAELRGLERALDGVEPGDGVLRQALLRDIARQEHLIRRARWGVEHDGGPQSSPSRAFMQDLRRTLDDRLLLQYGVLDSQLIGVAVTGSSMRFARLASIAEVTSSARQLAFALRRLCQPRSPSSVAAALDSARHEIGTLSMRLVKPFVDLLSDGEVVVCPPASLIGIPWGRLTGVHDRPVRIVPSASSWWSTSGRHAGSDRVVLVAGPDLPTAADEVHSLSGRYGEAEVLVGADATCEEVGRRAADAALVHLACHGRLRTDSPSFSSLRLADGPLTVHDLEHLDRPAHHWIIAACDLAGPGRLAGPDLEGAIAALLGGGAGGVIAAGVSVPDVDTRDLMVELHSCLGSGADLAESLRRARSAVDVTDPAGFVAGTAFSCYGGG